MSRRVPTFEVRVLVQNDNGKKHYSELVGGFVNDVYENRDAVRMYHIKRRTSNQARNIAEKYGHVLSVRKAARVNTWLPELQREMNTQDVLQVGDNKALALDEMIWVKRNKRRKNNGKDKKNV